MTDKEIVQALRCCADHSCSAKCPAYDGIAMRDCLGSIVTHWMPLPGAPEEGEKHE